jgi:hypothetical protein
LKRGKNHRGKKAIHMKHETRGNPLREVRIRLGKGVVVRADMVSHIPSGSISAVRTEGRNNNNGD